MQDHFQNRDENASKKIYGKANQRRNQQTDLGNDTTEGAGTYGRRPRRELYANIIMTLMICCNLWFWIYAHNNDWVLRFAFVIAVVWAVAGQYFLHRGMWAMTSPEEMALIAGLDFYRREVNWRRTLLGRVLQWSLGPIVLSIGALESGVGTGDRMEFRPIRNRNVPVLAPASSFG